METYTDIQKAAVIKWFYESKKIGVVKKRFEESYYRKAPEDKTIRNWVKNFETTGSSTLKKNGKGKTV
uniref:DUF4817 domain-containing protein n=1 Tax=Rhabditophanes sp. KR3021 TaxID=114890 RepID=A0AC35UFX0_9BILA